jgi:ABC-type nickel/cobalt efflux system permease component RcnA
MTVAWGSLLIVCVVSLAVGVAIVALASFALVGLSARQRAAVGGPSDGAPTLSAGAGTAIAGLCLLVIALIVLYGLYIVVF